MEESSISSVLDTSHQDSKDEFSVLIPREKRFQWSLLAQRYRAARKCVCSKAGLLVLFWSFVVGLANGMLLNDNPDLYLRITTVVYALGAYGFSALILCFFPLAGFLADIKWGRYKTVIGSLSTVLASLVLFLLFGGLFAVYIKCLDDGKVRLASDISLSFGLSGVIIVGIALVILLLGIVGFNANVVQFGMDQLHDSPGEDRTLFIHWYVWLYYLSAFIGQLSLNLGIQYPYNLSFNSYYNYIGWCLLVLIPLFVIVVLIVSLCLVRYKERWFLIEPGRTNPYKLVYKVTKFAYQHKIPVYRSAFTYCEDEVPKGLDLGKEKYGGSFSTEQVEDVKAFYGILKVLFSFGAVFFLEFAANSILPLYALHITPFHEDPSGSIQFNETLTELILVNTGLLSPLLVVICIPLYLFLLRPFIVSYLPGMLKRMGLGMLIVVLSLISSFAMDTAAHFEHSDRNNTVCMFSDTLQDSFSHNATLLLIQLAMSALSHMLMYVAVFEFICSQSPHSMKGFLIGLLYAIKGLYQVIATLLVIPFARDMYPSCGFYYYLVNIVVGLFALLMYVLVARRYRYRERDEPSYIRRYAEEYYSKSYSPTFSVSYSYKI